MTYAGTRDIHDADSHIMETPDWLVPFADPDVRSRLEELNFSGTPEAEPTYLRKIRDKHVDPEYRAADEAELMLRKNWAAIGSFIKDDRPKALDLLGFRSQLVEDGQRDIELPDAPERAGHAAPLFTQPGAVECGRGREAEQECRRRQHRQLVELVVNVAL